MADQEIEPMSIMDFPAEILEAIARPMHADTLASFAASSNRLHQIAARFTERLRVPFINVHLLSFLRRQEVAQVQFLDMSNCHAASETIQSLILECLSVKELNVVNSGLKFSHLLSVLGRLNSLERLSFSLLEPLKPMFLQKKFPVCRSLQVLYLETTTSEIFMTAAMLFINSCEILRKLHINFIGERRLYREHPNSMGLKAVLRNTLNTVIVSCHASNLSQSQLILDCLFGSRLERAALQTWKDQTRSCYIYENGNFNTREFTLRDQDDVLRDAFSLELQLGAEGPIELARAAPRGLKLNCPLSSLSIPFIIPETLLLPDLKELDLTECYRRFPVDLWMNFLDSSPGLEALAVNMTFVNPIGMKNAKFSRFDPEQPWLGFNLISSLKGVKLKRLFITGLLTTHIISSNNFAFTSKCFLGFEQLTHLEELTLHRVSANATIFRALTHYNLRIVRLHLLDVNSVQGLEDMIKGCPRLKFFKLELPTLQLDSQILWNALAPGIHELEQICLSTDSKKSVNVDVLLQRLPPLIQQLEVLHIHACSIHNYAQLDEQVSAMMKRYQEDNPHRHFEFLPMSEYSLSYIENTDLTASFPGRSLCATVHYIARIKVDGWDLRS